VIEARSWSSWCASLVLVSLASTCTPSRADPGYYVVTAYDNAGQRSIDLRYWTVNTDAFPATRWPEIGIGYGVNSRWYTELFASFIGTQDTATRLSTWNWQNEYLLTQGQYPIDVAIHAMLTKHAAASDGYTLETAPVLQTDIGRTQLNANVFFERTFDADQSSPTQLKYQWQIKHRWKPALQFGLQGFGELGEWDHWAQRDQQSHRAGPAIFGKVALGEGQAVLYQAAVLFGSTYGLHGNMFSMRMQYVF
jgi:hypothetical protein